MTHLRESGNVNADLDPNLMIPRTAYRLLAEKEAEVRAERDRLRAAIENYILWEPGRAGHAAAHRKLCEALKGPSPHSPIDQRMDSLEGPADA